MAEGAARRTAVLRVASIAFALLCAIAAAALMAQSSAEDRWQVWDGVRVALIFVTTAWLAWGAVQAFVGVPPRKPREEPRAVAGHAPTVMLVPICNEDADAVMARIAAMDASMRTAGLDVHVAVLSDTRDAAALAREQRAFARLYAARGGAGRIFYRNRTDNRGRKAGNIEDFVRRHGAAYEFAVILDADSLMEGDTVSALIARMQAEPDLGLLQTLPVIVGARSVFGRAMQFAARFHSPVFARGLARLQGRTGPFWGHNAIVRVRALAECCALPELTGPPPFGGTILSHDYVEAALLARGGWRVAVDETLGGSFEEGPDTLLAHAKRDRRWCQGNLQHTRLLNAPGLLGWSRFVFAQGIVSYLVSILWGAFLVASVVATVAAPAPDYFPDPYQLFPAFPDDRTREIIALAIGIGGLLLLPKVAILAEAIGTGRAAGFGGGARAAGSVLAEVALSSLIAPVLLMYQSRAVLEVISGRDGGWPANQRGEGRIDLVQGLRAGAWIAVFGVLVLAVVAWLAPALTIWLLPVALPMAAAPLILSWTSRPAPGGLFAVPDDAVTAPVVRAFHAELAQYGDRADGGAKGAAA